MNTERIDNLLENYFDGKTTVNEEKELRNFFSQKQIPDKYKAEKAMFDFFAASKAPKVIKKPLYKMLWVQSVAVSAVVVLAFGLFLQMPQGQVLLSGGSYVIKDGIVYSDPQIVHDEALKALDAVSGGAESKPKSTENDEAQTIMLEQLSQFGR